MSKTAIDEGTVTECGWKYLKQENIKKWKAMLRGHNGSVFCWHEYIEYKKPLPELISAVVRFRYGKRRLYYSYYTDISYVQRCVKCNKIKFRHICYDGC